MTNEDLVCHLARSGRAGTSEGSVEGEDDVSRVARFHTCLGSQSTSLGKAGCARLICGDQLQGAGVVSRGLLGGRLKKPSLMVTDPPRAYAWSYGPVFAHQSLARAKTKSDRLGC